MDGDAVGQACWSRRVDRAPTSQLLLRLALHARGQEAVALRRQEANALAGHLHDVRRQRGEGEGGGIYI